MLVICEFVCLSMVKQEKSRTEDLALIALSKAFEQAEHEFITPPLNGSQEDAASNFLNSAKGSSIMLVPGPNLSLSVRQHEEICAPRSGFW
jgi:hypothetical protein